MVIFGSDPDAPEKEWTEHTRRVFVSKPVGSLTNYFAYHPRMSMGQRCHEADKVILHNHFSRALKRGFSEQTLRSMVDRFFQSWAAEYNTPVYAFVSKKVQDVLEREVEVVSDDPILTWLLNGMPDTGPLEDPKEMRKCLLLEAGDTANRYPDVVADIVRLDYSYEGTRIRLHALAAIINWHINPDYELINPDYESVLSSRHVEFPVELSLQQRRPKSIRPLYPTVHQAVAALPIKRKTTEWL